MRSTTIMVLLVLALTGAAGCFLAVPTPDSPDSVEETGAAAPVPEAAKPAPGRSAEPGKRDIQEERRKAHLNIIRLAIELTPEPQVKITARKNPATISRYAEERDITGSYYVTKQGVFLCETGPCNVRWVVRFTYTDEAGKSEAFLLQGSENVFGGMTPSGTSRRRLDWCINGECNYFPELGDDIAKRQFEVGRYIALVTKTSVHIRRSDIAQEILDAGRRLSDY